MPKAIDEALEQAELERERRSIELEIEPNGTSLDLLQAIYRSPTLPLNTRMRAAGMALPHEHPKLGVSMNIGMSEEFAVRLEAAIRRSNGDHEPKLIEPPRSEQRVIETPSPKPTVVDKRFRRI